ncbi:MAG: prenyltransferase [Firmicutes bacterium]|jgi:1,4-dihydroxy-2-naphthoate octaprenyltransferase|nr:prenyltransferase [Bacillota bacterium]
MTRGLNLQALVVLLRWPAVAAFSGGGIFLAASLAEPAHRVERWFDLLLLTLAVLALHGVTSHALNDWIDWLSGTDKLSPGLLSGGSRIIPRGLASTRDLIFVGIAALILTLILSFWLVVRRGTGVLLPFAVGFWSVLAYSLPPLRLAYRPILGEWLAAFPALLACILGAFWILTGHLGQDIWLAALIYGFLALAWFAEHHLADISADLAAQPQKLTTAAWVNLLYGRAATRYVPSLYALLALLPVAFAASAKGRTLLLAALPALASSALALMADPSSALATTRAEQAMMVLAMLEAGLLILLF